MAVKLFVHCAPTDECDNCTQIKIRLDQTSDENEKLFYTAQLEAHKDTSRTERQEMKVRNETSRLAYVLCC